MAVRVTATEVKEIMDSCTTSDTIVDTFITAASALIDQIFSGDTEIGDTLLKELERWLTAHLIASTIHRTASKEKIGEAELTYTGQWGKKLELTPYGQMILLLDTTGKMGNVGKAAASMYAIKSFD